MSDFKLKIGCTVVVVDNGETYTTYDKAAKWMNLHDFLYMKKPKDGSIHTVVNFCFHEETGRILIGLRDKDGAEFIIGPKGVKLCKEVTIDEFKRHFGQDAVLVN